MQAQVKNQRDGTVLLSMDAEAARATFASVVFASRFHDGFRSLEKVAKKALEEKTIWQNRRDTTCR
ncbi:MAG TPA: hypothetical protein VK578_08690 [Edaphobacter sp.]|jgi:hypothetical protein|nr:hypothetical protein [Edaphobacter sp.]